LYSEAGTARQISRENDTAGRLLGRGHLIQQLRMAHDEPKQAEHPARRCESALLPIPQGRYRCGDALGKCLLRQSRLRSGGTDQDLLGRRDPAHTRLSLVERLAQVRK